MSLRLKVAAIFTAALIIGYITGVYTTESTLRDSVRKAFEEKEAAISHARELETRLNSLCGDAVLKFVPCPEGLEVCVCGAPDKYLTD
jgi:hypothetical protein